MSLSHETKIKELSGVKAMGLAKFVMWNPGMSLGTEKKSTGFPGERGRCMSVEIHSAIPLCRGEARRSSAKPVESTLSVLPSISLT